MEESKTCDMHDGEKLGQYTTGKLVQSWRNVELNPFPAGMSLIKTDQKVGTFFSYRNRLDIIYGIVQSIGVAQIIIQVYLNGTCIAAQHGLLFYLIRDVICFLFVSLFYNLNN